MRILFQNSMKKQFAPTNGQPAQQYHIIYIWKINNLMFWLALTIKYDNSAQLYLPPSARYDAQNMIICWRLWVFDSWYRLPGFRFYRGVSGSILSTCTSRINVSKCSPLTRQYVSCRVSPRWIKISRFSFV